ncbi:AraC family transcriptional regulator [Microbacterium sp. KUDC0406]|uniref:AraC family transcriptional regulator n=1 Tax=Microbacterium sp. KUDC0406 TaxID=2909588 RepID=UPI001F19E892|nr:AraC family transcriptional regulator [Microbacterium sp. KUDC0406]UJP09721.1 AraC family transcriptional regulator [Microbacterium sp. KUDC0406]
MSLIAMTPPRPHDDSADHDRGDALATLLDAVDVSIRNQRRHRLIDDATLVVDPAALSFAYVLSGNLQIRSAGQSVRRLTAGDVLLVSGRPSTALVAQGAASVLLSELALADEAAYISALLPDLAWITDFATIEPAAAALAQVMGLDAGSPDDCTKRAGDGVICRMMAKTVLASVIRAWAAGGCAPEGWPAAASDPFLGRVVDAINAEPGRDWTVEALAAVGAMSRSVFAERFRLVYGVSPAGYVTTVRMRSAQDLLARGLGVSAVSRELGYASDEGFSRAFRRHVGTTPSAWRAQHQLVTA